MGECGLWAVGPVLGILISTQTLGTTIWMDPCFVDIGAPVLFHGVLLYWRFVPYLVESCRVVASYVVACPARRLPSAGLGGPGHGPGHGPVRPVRQVNSHCGGSADFPHFISLFLIHSIVSRLISVSLIVFSLPLSPSVHPSESPDRTLPLPN